MADSTHCRSCGAAIPAPHHGRDGLCPACSARAADPATSGIDCGPGDAGAEPDMPQSSESSARPPKMSPPVETLSYARGRGPAGGMTLTNWAVLALILVPVAALLISIWLPCGARKGGLARRTVCMANLMGVGVGLYTYASENNEMFPIAAHPAATGDRTGLVDYTRAIGSYRGSADDSRAGNTALMSPPPDRLSTTRNMWELVRTGASSSKQFVCNSTRDTPNDDWNLMSYWDFGSGDITGPATAAEARAGWGQVSYGYQVPYGRHGRRSTDRDPDMPVMADKGPFGAAIDGGLRAPPAITAVAGDEPADWMPWNSPNHGGEGQVVLFADAHVEFRLTPAVGINNDNIYTQWGTTDDAARDREQGNPPTAGGRETPAHDTDTLIYP